MKFLYTRTNEETKFNALVNAAYEPGQVDALISSARTDAEREMLIGERDFLRMEFDSAAEHFRQAKASTNTDEIRAFSLTMLASTCAEIERFQEFDMAVKELHLLDADNLTVKMTQFALYDSLRVILEYKDELQKLIFDVPSEADRSERLYLIFLYSRLLMATGQYDMLLCLTRSMSLLCAKPPVPIIVADMMISASVILSLRNDHESAKKLMGEACDLLKPDGFMYPFRQYAAYKDHYMNEELKKLWPECSEKLADRRKHYLHSRPKASKGVSKNEWATCLTQRELDVATLVASGMPNKVIAARLDISTNTVKTLLCRTFDKLGVNNRRELSVYIHAFPYPKT